MTRVMMVVAMVLMGCGEGADEQDGMAPPCDPPESANIRYDEHGDVKGWADEYRVLLVSCWPGGDPVAMDTRGKGETRCYWHAGDEGDCEVIAPTLDPSRRTAYTVGD